MSTTSVAFQGATGGCALAALVLTLEAGHQCIALARTPEKLKNLLEERRVPAERIASHLKIVQGDAKDTTKVKEALRDPVNPSTNCKLIVSGIGGVPKLQMSVTEPVTLTDPDICKDATKATLDALRELKTELGDNYNPPLYTMVSTAGISIKERDTPAPIAPVLKYALQVPHADKEVAESMLDEAADHPLGGFCSVRPSLLKDGPANPEAIKHGWEWSPHVVDEESGPGPMIGYFITRGSVGYWIYEHIVKTGGQEWRNKMVTITE